MDHDVVIIGGGPAGLAAALTLGRARKRVLMCDGGPRRNAAAEHVQGFVTRDGITPDGFRRIAREQLARYPNVEVRDGRVDEIRGERGAFEVVLEAGRVSARRVLLCTGVIDELPEIEGFRALWGKSIFTCPYCHGWELQDRAFGVLVERSEELEFALLIRGWTSALVALNNGRFAVAEEQRARLARAGVGLDERRIRGLVASDGALARVEFEDGQRLPLEVLFARTAQRQVPLVQGLGLELDAGGYVRVDELTRETSRPGVYAAGDLVATPKSAILAAASGTLGAAMLNHALTIELVTGGH